jgi:hypothetical protein
MTRESCNSHPTSQPSLSKNTSSSDDDLPTTPVDHPSPCASPIPDYDHQMEKIEKSIQKEASIQLSFPCDIPFVLTNQLEGYLPEAITTYSNTIVHHTKQRDDKLCTDLSHQLWGEVEQETQWTRIKWNLSQWMGIGLGEIRDKDYDDEGRPKNIVISGLCVTTEPGLLPEVITFYDVLERPW